MYCVSMTFFFFFFLKLVSPNALCSVIRQLCPKLKLPETQFFFKVLRLVELRGGQNLLTSGATMGAHKCEREGVWLGGGGAV